tara:strand:+ start:520 stop:1320 length:801 start_codon:yes stop_codon:yes gene_type:complete
MSRYLAIALISFGILIAGVVLGTQSAVQEKLKELNANTSWQSLSSPGDLSQAHQILNNQCESCHQPFSGVDDKQCILCHANDESLLIRQPTAFHADVQECSLCHTEHQGKTATPTQMDHELLVTMIETLPEQPDEGATKSAQMFGELTQHIDLHGRDNPLLSKREAMLNCASCHANDDRHFKLFSDDCGACHSTNRWLLADYRHPATNSTDCSQCHQAPPSHYKPHYKMMSQKIAGQPNASVKQCYRCHLSTSWNDIQQLGLYKHH